MYPVAILAGGLATRLRPLTDRTPKSLVDVGGKPFVIRQLEYLRGQGITEITLCIGHLGYMIQDVVGDGQKIGLKVTYSDDGSKPLGTGGALLNAINNLGKDFFVLYGDSYTPIQLDSVQRAYQASGMPALMTIIENNDQWDKSNVLYRDGRIVAYSKRLPQHDMKHIDYGVSIMSSRALGQWSDCETFDLSEVYEGIASQSQLSGYLVKKRFYEIGTPRGLLETREYIKLRERT
jgi:N-acetyl-alpha-D-muramate 1-phosphate uridylyltransferase